MATSDWWIDPPRNNLAGGRIISKNSDGSVDETRLENQFYYAGFECVKEWSFPLDVISDHYESYYSHSYFKLQVPTLSGVTLDSATLYVMVGSILNVQVPDTTQMSLKAYYKSSYNANDFPWATLDEDDEGSAGWTEIGTFDTVAGIQTDYNTYGPYWMDGLDITTAIQTVIASGWGWLGIRLQLTHKAPIGWDYDHRPSDTNQLLEITFQGAMTTYWSNNLPPNHPEDYNHVTPWLKISYSVIPPEEDQEEPGEPYTTVSGSTPYPASGVVNCVTADVKAKSAIAGTSIGGLWYVWSGGGFWNKIFEVDSAITAVYIDYIKNLLDYPEEATAWFGTDSGDVYKTTDSFATWDKVKAFGVKVVEIRGSEMNSNKVVVATETDIYTTMDGGENWILAKSGDW